MMYSAFAYAGQRCEALFNSTNLSPAIVKKIDKSVRVKYKKMYTHVSKKAPLTQDGKMAGYDLLKNFRYFSSYRIKHSLSEVDLKKFGDLIFDQAKVFLNNTNIQYKLRNQSLVILPTGNHNLNIEARELLRETGTELVYNPYELLETGADALYIVGRNQLYISHNILIEGSVKENDVGKHEITHIYSDLYYRNDIPYLYNGFLSSKTSLPSVEGPYKESLGLDEMLAHYNQARANISDLKNLSLDKEYSKDDLLSLGAIRKTSLKTTLKNGHQIATSSLKVFSLALEAIKTDSRAIEFVKKENYYHATWTIKSKDSPDSYTIELPLLTQEKLSRKDLLGRVEIQLKKLKIASLYYRNIFKAGLDLEMTNIKEPLENLSQKFENYEVLLENKRNYQSENEVPTQKNLLQSLENGF